MDLSWGWDFVFVITCLAVQIWCETVERDTRRAFFHALHRVPKVGSDYSIVAIVRRFVGIIVVVVVELLRNDVQGPSVFKRPLVFVLFEGAIHNRWAYSSSGGHLAVMLVGMMAYCCRLVVVAATKRADVL